MAVTEQIAKQQLALATEPKALILAPETFPDFLAALKQEIANAPPADISTVKGRDAIKSLAFKVVKSRTALEAAADLLKEDAQKTVNKVNASLRQFKAELNTLAAEVRAPVTEWEAAEEQRLRLVEDDIQRLHKMARVSPSTASEAVFQLIQALEGWSPSIEIFKDRYMEAESLKQTTREVLEAAYSRICKDEADRKELEELRAAKAEADRLEAARLEADRRAKRDAEEAEADKRLKEAEAKAKAEAAIKQKAAEEAAHKRAVEQAAAQAERDMQEKIAKMKAEEDARVADLANRRRVVAEIEQALLPFVKTKTSASVTAHALVNGAIPHVKVTF